MLLLMTTNGTSSCYNRLGNIFANFFSQENEKIQGKTIWHLKNDSCLDPMHLLLKNLQINRFQKSQLFIGKKSFISKTEIERPEKREPTSHHRILISSLLPPTSRLDLKLQISTFWQIGLFWTLQQTTDTVKLVKLGSIYKFIDNFIYAAICSNSTLLYKWYLCKTTHLTASYGCLNRKYFCTCKIQDKTNPYIYL